MKTVTFIIFLTPLLVSAEDFKSTAQKILMPVKKAFMQELKVGMKQGPYNAIDTCHIKAPHLLENDYSQEHEIGRTSDKIRNPQNQPKKWMDDILKDYVGTTAEKPKAPKVYTVQKKLAYVEPIYIKPVCLSCHGSKRGSALKKIQKLYPNDKATGYKVGEFRGLFYVKQK